MVTVRAIKAFTYNTKDYVAGDPVEMVPLDAAIHARRGDVSLTRRTTPPVAPAPVPTRKRGTYRRRDLTAEDPTP